MIGRELAHYRIDAKLGQGGMGEVYLAHDAQLDRNVALKVLPPETAGSRERLQRFRREARTLASLNHPNIVTVYSIESANGIHFLTMELLEGSTLSSYIPEGGVDLPEFFRVSIALADALAAAHDGGLIHRDLKPSNVFVTKTGTVKVLDFGLAKFSPSTTAPIDTEAPTDSLTDEHRVLGTIPYMAPEQLQGRPIDHRADIFALGIVLYQLATGDRPFQGTTSVEVASAILRDTPTPANEIRVELPHHIGRVISLCLEKDREHRLQSVKDLRNELALLRREIESGKTEEMLPRPVRPSFAWRRWAAVALLPIAVLAGIWLTRWFPEDEAPKSMHIPMAPPPGLRPSLGFGPSVAISADGETLCYVMESGTTTHLYVKELGAFDARELPGTEGGRSPAFSPSGDWIVFFDEDDRLLKKIALSGGQPIVLTEADGQWGLTWASEETILFTSTYSGLMKVDAAGGEPESLIKAGRMQYFWPRMIDGTDTVLFSVLPARGSFEDAAIATVPLSGGTPTIVLESGYYPHYSLTGHLVFVQDRAVLAAPFDRGRLQLTGPAKTVLKDVWASAWTGYADFAFSLSGTVVYVSGGPDPTRAKLVSADRHGRVTPLADERRPYRLPRFSPDGGQVALTIVDEQVDVWTFDLERRSFSRQTDSPSWEGYPQWHPSGNLLALSSMRDGLAATYLKDLQSNAIKKLFPSEHPTYPRSWSPDGKMLAYDEENPNTGRDVGIYSAESGETVAFLASSYNESAPQFSPDGRYIAYQSDEAGHQLEVYVRPFPGPNPRQKISNEGGRAPRWSRDGRELFYLLGSRLMAVPVETGGEFIAGTPIQLFEGGFGHSYDVAPDGQSFLMLQEVVDGDPPLRINMITDWLVDVE